MSRRKKRQETAIETWQHFYEERDGIPDGVESEVALVPGEMDTIFSDVPMISLIEMMVQRSNMLIAYKRVVSNNGSAGMDGVSVKELKSYTQRHWSQHRMEILSGAYKPQPVLRVEIPKPDGSKRMLGIPTVMDRMLQQALLQILTPIFDPEFSESSFGFRPGRSAHQAIKRSQEIIAGGKHWVVDLDLAKFFDRVNHDVLMSRVKRRVKDKRILKLIASFLRAGIFSDGKVEPRKEGTPQGGPLSPLLANILLDDLDKELEERGHLFCRYADDLQIYAGSQKAAERILKSVTTFVEKKLKLEVNRKKSKVGRPSKSTFLGYRVHGIKNPQPKIAPKSIKKLLNTLKRIFRRGRGRQIDRVIKEINPVIRGWFHYFKLNSGKKRFVDLDKWIRHRLRVIIWRHWKKPYTRYKRFKQFGFSEDQARQSAYNGRGPWWNAKASHMNEVLPLSFFSSKGLIRLSDLHDKFYLTRTAVYGTVRTVV